MVSECTVSQALPMLTPMARVGRGIAVACEPRRCADSVDPVAFTNLRSYKAVDITRSTAHHTMSPITQRTCTMVPRSAEAPSTLDGGTASLGCCEGGDAEAEQNRPQQPQEQDRDRCGEQRAHTRCRSRSGRHTGWSGRRRVPDRLRPTLRLSGPTFPGTLRARRLRAAGRGCVQQPRSPLRTPRVRRRSRRTGLLGRGRSDRWLP